jgi:threonine/homoserine/homoserine lactone efflux protein
MNLFATLILFTIMIVLAAVPSCSVALVVTRAATLGIRDGAAVAAGIVVGDLTFAALAILGMSALAETMGTFFAIVRYVGAAYLIWLGFSLICSRKSTAVPNAHSGGSTMIASFASGLLLTLGDVKAILFYASLFPTFVDMAHLTVLDIVVIFVVTALTVGGVKLIYAFAARSIISRLHTHRSHRHARTLAGSLMIGTGTYIIAKT